MKTLVWLALATSAVSTGSGNQAVSLVAVGASRASDASAERTMNMKIRMKIAGKVVIATVADNETARDFGVSRPNGSGRGKRYRSRRTGGVGGEHRGRGR